MSLSEIALCTTEDAWEYLNPSQEDRDRFEPMMEAWINGASAMIEAHVNRPVKARVFDEYQDGNGRTTLMLDYYPVKALTTLEVQTRDLNTTYVISTDRADQQLVFDYRTGKLTLLNFAQIGHFFCGSQNVHIVYTAGFDGYELEPFRVAVRELIQVYWRDIGQNPRVQQLNENVGNAFFSGRFDPSKLSHQTQMLVNNYRRTQV